MEEPAECSKTRRHIAGLQSTVSRMRVYMVGGQQVIEGELLRFAQEHGYGEWLESARGCGTDAEILCETAGRLCYMSFVKRRPGGLKAFLQHIIESRHGTILEHAVFNFLITGVSRSLTHELVRHRIASYSQLSQRFVDETDTAFVLSKTIEDNPRALVMWDKFMQLARQYYSELVDVLSAGIPEEGLNQEEKTARRKLIRQAARDVLPNATETRIFMTINARSLRNLLEQRANKHAALEIRQLAMEIFDLVRDWVPLLFADYEVEELPDGTKSLSTANIKV